MKRQQSADGKLDVLIHPTKLVAVGPGYNDFITGLSLIVHQNARLNVLQWKKVPQMVDQESDVNNFHFRVLFTSQPDKDLSNSKAKVLPASKTQPSSVNANEGTLPNCELDNIEELPNSE
ncbi:hypothetical protein JHK82_052310 [Glycine max]|nr:hypothetical protein JHK86_052142 [Glycine max]KAG4926512.1 hypothetical protein JHK85_052998 [Glycine max]KAG5082149.1 hypothetical protein JHK84_052187 [Glycine max]KAG5084913.1 hypothetical protein JHK82_052310 [Glycine max]